MIYDGSNHAVWATNTVVPATPGVPGLVGRLLTGQGLLAGRSIHSADGRFTLLMQADGNMVLYGPGNQALWASRSSGHTDVWDAVMQSDGNLVVYDAHGTWCCMTRTTRVKRLLSRAWARCQALEPKEETGGLSQGCLVVYDAHGHAIWSSKTVMRLPPSYEVSRIR